ncbi:hypothetical protein HPP92_019651 [Vanilla planifolia]|uniref:Uncharacterized protein n=1 Tax=Vanilla planifolia TaxID=51239 RepID=A0A835UKY6_VANPL|nr:hypothetical protein HPP92_019651 [Vanilla planifolia]
MSRLEMLLSHARRHVCLRQLHPLLVPPFHRVLSLLSFPSTSLNQFKDLRSFSTVPIKPVAYPQSPKIHMRARRTLRPPRGRSSSEKAAGPRARTDSSLLDAEAVSTDIEPRAWTRRDVRFVKDVPKITPVSYPSRVAPLPEDRTAATEEAGGAYGEKEEDDQLRSEGRG